MKPPIAPLVTPPRNARQQKKHSARRQQKLNAKLPRRKLLPTRLPLTRPLLRRWPPSKQPRRRQGAKLLSGRDSNKNISIAARGRTRASIRHAKVFEMGIIAMAMADQNRGTAGVRLSSDRNRNGGTDTG